MNPFAVLMFIAATAFLGVVLTVIVRGKKTTGLSAVFDGYVLLILIVIWVVMLVGLVGSIF